MNVEIWAEAAQSSRKLNYITSHLTSENKYNTRLRTVQYIEKIPQ